MASESWSNTEFVIKYSRSKDSVQRLTPIGTTIMAPNKSPDEKFDVMAYVIHCSKHNTIAVYRDTASAIKWIPFTPILTDT